MPTPITKASLEERRLPEASAHSASYRDAYWQ
jgi:hypothetical protein